MSTQLRLITKLADQPPATGKAESPRPLRGRVSTGPASKRQPSKSNRRAVHWQSQWRLDDRTRQVGKAGVASARAALRQAS